MVDASAIGMTFRPTSARVEPGRLRFFLETIGETNPVYCDDDAAREARKEHVPKQSALGMAAAIVAMLELWCKSLLPDTAFALRTPAEGKLAATGSASGISISASRRQRPAPNRRAASV